MNSYNGHGSKVKINGKHYIPFICLKQNKCSIEYEIKKVKYTIKCAFKNGQVCENNKLCNRDMCNYIFIPYDKRDNYIHLNKAILQYRSASELYESKTAINSYSKRPYCAFSKSNKDLTTRKEIKELEIDYGYALGKIINEISIFNTHQKSDSLLFIDVYRIISTILKDVNNLCDKGYNIKDIINDIEERYKRKISQEEEI